jgi:ribosomal protein S18 acetylase RimI-like enzyme
MKIRPYSPSDWPRLCEIHDAARMDELRASAGTAAFLTLQETAENEGLFDARLDVLEIDGTVAGFVAFSPEELTWLYVEPRYYRRGAGRALLRHAIANAGPRLRAEVLEGNEPALRLYLTEGFQIVERVEGRLEGNESFAAIGYRLERIESTNYTD